MKEIRLTNKVTKTFQGNSRGFSLIEVLVALALLGIIAAAFLGGLATTSKALIIADKRTTAESLARSQMEYVKNQDYSTVPWEYELPLHTPSNPPPNPPSWWDDADPPTLPSGYTGYSVEIRAEDFDADGDGNIEVPGEDEGIRKITVNIYHPDTDSDPIITLEGYKVDR